MLLVRVAPPASVRRPLPREKRARRPRVFVLFWRCGCQRMATSAGLEKSGSVSGVVWSCSCQGMATLASRKPSAPASPVLSWGWSRLRAIALVVPRHERGSGPRCALRAMQSPQWHSSVAGSALSKPARARAGDPIARISPTLQGRAEAASVRRHGSRRARADPGGGHRQGLAASAFVSVNYQCETPHQREECH